MSTTRVCHVCTCVWWHFFWKLFQLCFAQNSSDNEAEFGKAAASTLHNNFYIDDFLKSAGDLNMPNQLVKDVISMCKSGAFDLKKFISNSKELLQSIPEQQRRQGTKDQDLSGDLPTDKALRIC